MKSRKMLIIFIVLIFTVVLPLFLWLILGNGRENVEKLPEKGGGSSINIKDGGSLYGSFTYTDYQAIQQRLTEYVVSRNGNGNDTVVISDLKTPFREGYTSTFSVEIPSLNKSVGVVVEIPTSVNEVAFFMIPTENYKVNLYSAK